MNLEKIVKQCKELKVHKDYCDKLQMGQNYCPYARGVIHVPSIKLGIQGYLIKYRCMHYVMHK